MYKYLKSRLEDIWLYFGSLILGYFQAIFPYFRHVIWKLDINFSQNWPYMASSTIDTINEVEISSPASASFISLYIFAKFLQCYFNGRFQSIDNEIMWEEGTLPLLKQRRRVEKYFSGFTVLTSFLCVRRRTVNKSIVYARY